MIRTAIIGGRAALWFALLAVGIGALAAGTPEPAVSNAGVPDIRDFTTRIADLRANVLVDRIDQKELQKIGRDFALPYSFKGLMFQYKYPGMIRMSGKIPILGEAVFILNGASRYYHIPRMEKRTENLEKSPTKRQSLLEYGGVLTSETLRFMEARYLKSDMVDGHAVQVFSLAYQGVTAGSYYRLYLDPVTRVTLKREWFDGGNNLRATFLYSRPREVTKGIWIPERMEILNAEGISSAGTTLGEVQVNAGLSDDLFTIQHP